MTIMKNIILILAFVLTFTHSFSQKQSVTESDYQIGLFNASYSKNGFTVSKCFNRMSIQVSSLPLFSSEFKVFSSLGVSGQVVINESDFGKVYTYSGVQRIQTRLGLKKEHINLGIGLGFKTKINQVLELVCQGGYNTLNVSKINRHTIFNSEVGMYYNF